METKFPTLRRPKKKLCYLTNKESPTKKAEGLLILEDIDRIFDDLDPPCDDLLPSSSQYMTFNVEANQSEGEASTGPQKGKLMGTIQKGHMGPKGDEIHPSRSPSPKLVIDQDIPFEAHMPAKTSSPIETNMAVKALDIEKDRSVSPLLFACEDEGDAKTEPPPDGHVTEESIDFESPPSKVVLSRPKMSSQQKKVEEACKESQTLKINPPQKPQTPVVEVQRKTPRIEMVDPPAAAVRREPELAAPEKTIETVPEQPLVEPARVQKNFAAFIQKLRGAAQSKPACTRKSASPVKVPTPPPEPEDDFLILEDDAAPFSFSIRSKSAKKQSGTTSIDKGSVTDKSTKGSSAVTQQEPEETERKPREPSGKRKTKKTKEKKNEVTEADRAEEELPGPEEPPVDSIDEKKPNNKKKQRLKKVPSEDSDEEEELPKTSKETREDEPAVRIDKKALNSKTLKDAKTSRAKPMKRGKKVPQGSDGETGKASKKQGPSSEEVGATDLGGLSDKEIMNPEAQTDEDSADVKRDKNNKLPVVSEGSSPDDSLTLGRRRRRPPGEWWMHRSPEETTGKCNQPPVKEATRQNTEPSTAAAAAASPVRPKKDKYDQLTIKKYKKHNQEPCGASPVKDKVLKNINPTQPAAPTSQKANKGKEKKQNTGGETQGEESHTTEAEPFEEQQQQEQEGEEEGEEDDQSSPFVFSHRELSNNSGEKPFQKVYHPVSSKNKAPQRKEPQRKEPQRKEPLSAVRRGRRPPGSWWAVQEVESVSPQQQKPKPRKKRIRSPPPPKESSSVPLLNPQSPVKRSRAASEDMFSLNETQGVGRGRRKRQKVRERPVEEIPPADCSVFSTPNAFIHHSSPQDEGPQRYSVDRSKHLGSGPSSMIVLQQFEEEDSLILPNSRVHAPLSLSDLCAPPLEPMTLLTKDKANLAEWFMNLWELPLKIDSTEIFPDQFEWFCYQGRAIGFTMDVNSGSFCNGKMLLGSFMKKPLWVDHSAATVFNLLTSSVSVTINGRESCFNPGKSFMVPCGSAYSLQNVCAQPAVLYFTRIISESSE